ncbi:protein gp37 [Paenibacillus castaneae]|nr:protein gp37 [Paenibacillus castaneae]
MLTCESNDLEDYLKESDEIDFSHHSIRQLSSELFNSSINEIEFVKKTYEFVRDEIAHSWDIYTSPNQQTIDVLKKNTNCLNMYIYKLPTSL